jgi:hypothetical protein
MGDSKTDVVFPSTESPVLVVPRYALMMYRLGRVPWAFVLLMMGIGVAGIAIVLAVMEQPNAIFAFVLAVAMLLGGIVSLMVQNFREGRKVVAEETEEERPLHVYRQTPCPLDEAMYNRLVGGAESLLDNIKEKDWQYETRAYQERLHKATGYAKQRRFREAFREQCRAMLVLMEAVHRYRGKNEDFKPGWGDKQV